MTHWEKVVPLMRADCMEVHLVEETMWQAVVLISKGKGEYNNIGIMEVMWKVVVLIINLRLTASIIYHDFLHGFQAGCGTRTANLEAKRIKQLAAMR